MNLIKHRNKIYIEFIQNNSVIKRSLGLPYAKENIKYAKKYILPLCQWFTVGNNNKTLKELCNEILFQKQINAKITTFQTAKYAINRFFDFVEDKQIDQYTNLDIQHAVSKMINAKLSVKTIALLFVYPKQAFKIAKELNLISKIPISKIKFPKKSLYSKKHVFTKAQICKILSSATGELKLFLLIAFYSGARSGEILALKRHDIDFKKGTISISKNQTRYELTTPKNGISREIVIPKELKKLISEKDLQNENLFTTTYFQLYYQFKKLLKSLDIPHVGLHSTRHTYITHLIHNKISPIYIANNVGHSNLNLINSVYSHFLLDNNEIKKLNKSLKFDIFYDNLNKK